MCGIVGFVGELEALHVLLPALQKLEYRGYDSAGIAVVSQNEIRIVKRRGKIADLIASLKGVLISGKTGIGHTRWATHGEPSDINAHPHTDCSRKIAIAHNGILDNFAELRAELEKRHKIVSDTDTELIAHLIEEEYRGNLEEAVARAVRKLEGSWAIVAVCLDEPDKIVATRKSAPLVVGLWENGNLVSSDIPSLISFTRKVIPLDDGEIAVVRKDKVKIFKEGVEVKKNVITITWDPQQAEKGGYKHFMLKEIFEQPHVLSDTIYGFLSAWNKIPEPQGRLTFVACGTSYHAGLLGKIWIEEIAGIPVSVEYASEFRYRRNLVGKDDVVVAISQSGETADTLEAVRMAREKGARIWGVVNVLGSTLSREADVVIHTNAGPEIGVAATKTFLSQITVMYLLALRLAGFSKREHKVDALKRISDLLESFIHNVSRTCEDMAEEIAEFKNSLYLGRWLSYPVAMEGALKLKEISYIHAEAYPAGEMKHGPIALIDRNMLSVVFAPADRVFSKTLSNVQEILARDGRIILITDSHPNIEIWRTVKIPSVEDEYLYPFVLTPVLQLLAYHTAVWLGNDVDQPRNLAKSVTVE